MGAGKASGEEGSCQGEIQLVLAPGACFPAAKAEAASGPGLQQGLWSAGRRCGPGEPWGPVAPEVVSTRRLLASLFSFIVNSSSPELTKDVPFRLLFLLIIYNIFFSM